MMSNNSALYILTADELEKRQQVQDLKPRKIVVRAGDEIQVDRTKFKLARDSRSDEKEEIIRVVEK